MRTQFSTLSLEMNDKTSGNGSDKRLTRLQVMLTTTELKAMRSGTYSLTFTAL